ncbi:mitochondrial 54S ribosomal protein mL44 KNAG_0M02170 [Huiozyma naganishii CBS 8797]|uniref:Large ribosomal subunit protein mL44 n=1 Tax=Huiozyma naganishii (strain ATCC MYA-139 / BCRC 22969 / CBS 8797 / KCTC 17520 / NBRC 10181 / NCYC 3082 / Yp74L-3) TaxID=1071383 RepID=J7RE05_HUIN7|nr:hypothetical protein KNAG_0M02170 [Kazachstania naganishii CBS 8797]CCK73070.1 hypothetical protein KNAG_0M02170 [Kazachstania naganishii CBS 8797]
MLKRVPAVWYSTVGRVARGGVPPGGGGVAEFRKYVEEEAAVLRRLPQEVTDKSSALVALHSRLRLPEAFTTAHLARCLSCKSGAGPGASGALDNRGLNIFGKNLLTMEVTAELLRRFPRLPLPVLNAAVDGYIGEGVLAGIARGWGVQPETRGVLDRFLSGETVEATLGRLRYVGGASASSIASAASGSSIHEAGSVADVSGNATAPEADAPGTAAVATSIPLETGTQAPVSSSSGSALALFVRSTLAVLWTVSPALSTQFIRDHVLSRRLDVKALFSFEQPTRELARLCTRERLQRPTSRLLAESGRLSRAPVFIVGVFSGEEQLGEGFGSSLKEAKARAATDALMKWYCYSPGETTDVIDPGTVIV